MIKSAAPLLALLALAASPTARADECYAVSNLRGNSAYADSRYGYVSDSLPKALIVCFGAQTGTVTGTATQFTKYGISTLAGYASDRGIELFEVYQLDRVNNKMLFTMTRIGTKSVVPEMSDVVSSFVGDAQLLAN